MLASLGLVLEVSWQQLPSQVLVARSPFLRQRRNLERLALAFRWCEILRLVRRPVTYLLVDSECLALAD